MTAVTGAANRSEEHTSELQSHSEISYAVFCLKKKNRQIYTLFFVFVYQPSCSLFSFFFLCFFVFFLLIRRPPRFTLILTLFPYTTLFRSRTFRHFVCRPLFV